MIYLISLDGNHIKIGYTRDADSLKKRVGTFQVGSPHPVQVLTTFEGSRDDEAAIHDAFQAERVRGEWFHGCIPLRRLIEASRKEGFDLHRFLAETRRKYAMSAVMDKYRPHVRQLYEEMLWGDSDRPSRRLRNWRREMAAARAAA